MKFTRERWPSFNSYSFRILSYEFKLFANKPDGASLCTFDNVIKRKYEFYILKWKRNSPHQ
ncbi:hypothetical protein KL86DYS1_10446 [uncultured Dysgonomonas sp.]|uniref:Uncharacterized protein n=1 Tax=uncultured Dysgonomonas sp. TaxID=206096 RepID=A0A212IXD4_9BACT|nr:hypothetical protein KL86DYS1_10446 [uncultured Dysgonomonas sp.]